MAGHCANERRASFDVCAAFSEYATREKGTAGIIDSLTTLHTRAVFLAALEKEIQRAERFGHPFALVLLDVDRLAEINATHGYGAGDRVIERIGIVVRNYFRETDWVRGHPGMPSPSSCRRRSAQTPSASPTACGSWSKSGFSCAITAPISNFR